MILQVSQTSQVKGKIFLPASKSYSIRAFLIAALGGKSVIIHPSDCDDAVVSREIAKSLGASVKRLKDNCYEVNANLQKKLPSKIHVKESGTALRLLIPLVATRSQRTTITGEGTLKGRPNLFLTDTLRKMNVNIQGQGNNDSVPVKIEGGQITGGKISIDGSISSQFISALLMVLPQLKEDSVLTLKGKLVSQDYIMMTQLVLKQAGIKVKQRTNRVYSISGSQNFKGLKKFTVPSDDGLAAFTLAAACLLKSDLTLNGHFNEKLLQADGHIYALLNRIGVDLRKTSRSIKIKGPFVLKGGQFSLKDCPDLLPIMSVLALFAKGRTKFVDIAHARVKESDRISDLRNELLKVGADVRETKDQLIITPKTRYKENCLLDPHNDHRLAMAFCVLGLKVGVRVKDIECTHKSYPGFVKDFKSIGAKVLPKKP